MARTLRPVYFLLFVVFSFSSAAAAEQSKPIVPLDETGFTALAAGAFQKVDPDSTVAVTGPLHLRIKKGAVTWEPDLRNIYAYCQSHTSACGIELVFFIKQLAAAHQLSQPLQKSNLRIVVRTTNYVEALEKRYGEDADRLVKPLSGDLWAILVEDQPTAIRYPRLVEVEQLGVSPTDALKLATARSKEVAQSLIPHPKAGERRVLSVLFGDDGPNTFAFPELWAPVARGFGGTLIVSVPSTAKMYFIGDDTPSALNLLRKLSADEWTGAQHPLSQKLYRWTENGWDAVPPPPK